MREKSNKLLVINGRALSDKECAVIVIIWEEYLTVKSLSDFFINKRTLLHECISLKRNSDVSISLHVWLVCIRATD